MFERHKKKKLAYQVGLCRIALVVEAVHGQMKAQPSFAELFDGSGSEGEHRARLTYFWWVVLGGNTLSYVDWEVVEQLARTVTSPELLGEWLKLFRQAALPIIGEESTRAWAQRVEQLAHKFLLAREDAPFDLAKAS